MTGVPTARAGRHRDAPTVDERTRDPRYYDFRTQLRVVETGDWLSTLEAVGRAWLAEKGVELAPGVPASRSTAGAEAHLARLAVTPGSAVRFTLVEHGEQGEWRTEVLGAMVEDGTGWIGVTTRNSDTSFVNRPRIVTRILEQIEVRDGRSELVDDTWLITSQHVREFLQLLADPGRTLPVFVTGVAPDGDAERHVTWMRNRSKELAGLAHSYVVDAESAIALDRVLGRNVPVRPWNIRSFAPTPVPHDPEDALRHRVIGSRRLEGLSAGSARAMVGRIARFEAAERPEATVLRDARRAFDRMAVRDRFRRPLPVETTEGAATVPDAVPEIEPHHETGRPSPTAVETGESADQETAAEERRSSRPDVERRPESGVLGPLAPDGTTEAERPAAPTEPVRTPTTSPVSEPEPAEGPRSALLVEHEIGPTRTLAAGDQALVDRLLAATGRRDLGAVIEDFAALTSMLEDASRVALDHLEDSNRAQDTEQDLREQLDELERELSSEAGRRRTAERNLRDLARFDPTVDARDLAPTHPSDLPAPEQFSDIALVLEELRPFVVFTGDVEIVASLDEFDTNRVGAGKCWDGLLALHGYASACSAGEYEGSLHKYLQEPPEGYSAFPVGQYAAGESETTTGRRDLAAQRLLPVPSDVDPSGQAHMWAHLKLRKLGRVSPRLHFLDAVSGHGTVYVGYIGPHLGIAGS